MDELKDKEAKLKIMHAVPKDVEVTPVLQKMISVNIIYQTRSDAAYCARREAERFALEIENTDKVIDVVLTERQELERQIDGEKKHIEALEKTTAEAHLRIVGKLVYQANIG